MKEKKRKQRNRIITVVIIVLVSLGIATAATYLAYSNMVAKYDVAESDEVNEAQAIYDKYSSIASQGYIYGSSAVEMYKYFYEFSGNKESKFYTRMNKFLHVIKWSQPNYTSILNVDADTLSSVAWLDLTKDPMVIYCPDTGDNYYSLEVIDFYNNSNSTFFKSKEDISKRNFLITPPDWEGKVPTDTEQIKATTNYVLAYVRLMVQTPNDLERTKKIQAKFDIRPLSLHKDNSNPYDGVSDEFPSFEINSAVDFFNALSAVMAYNPPPPSEAGTLNFLKQLGIMPGGIIREEMYSEEELAGLNAGYEMGRKLKLYTKKTMNIPLSGGFWGLGAFGIYDGDYYKRSALMDYGLMTYTPEKFLRFSANLDETGSFLHGSNAYEIKFTSPPPCSEGWSLTMYRASNSTLVPNDLNVYQIGSRSNVLKYNSNGSLSIYVSAKKPDDITMINNWLPAPDDNFFLILRVYLPETLLLDGKWTYPKITKIK